MIYPNTNAHTNIQVCRTARLVGVSNTSHARHDTEDVVVDGVHTHLGCVCARDGGGGEHKLECGVVNAREVARAAGLVLLGSQCEGLHVDTGIGSAGVVLEGLDHIEVGSLTLREAVLAVELELGRDNGVLAPAVHVEGSLGQHECAGIGDVGSRGRTLAVKVGVGGSGPLLVASKVGDVTSTGVLEEATGDEGVGAGCLGGSTKGVDRVGESIDGIGVVEWLGTEGLVEGLAADEGRAVVDVGIGLDDPDKLLAGVVEVELDLVGGGTDRLVASELELLNEVLVGVLCHLAALISVQEDVVNVQGGSNKGLLVSLGDRDC